MNADYTDEQQVKKPNFLLVLVVLSSIYILFSIYGNILGLVNGPLSNDQLEAYKAEQYQNIETMKSEGIDDVAEMIRSTVDLTIYQNNNNYYSFHFLSIIGLFIGLVGVVFMFQLKKMGFHLYIVYSLFSILVLYMLTPIDIIPNFIVIGNLIISFFFVLMYAVNLKYMK